MTLATDLALFTETSAFISAYYPDLEALVQMAERLFPAGSSGAARLQWVYGQLLKIEAFAAKAEAMWPTVSKYVALLVSLLPRNATTEAVTAVSGALTQLTSQQLATGVVTSAQIAGTPASI